MISLVKRNAIFYQTILTALFLTITATIIYFWNQGYVDGKKITEVHIINDTLLEVKKGTQLTNIEKSISQGETLKSIQELEKLTLEMKNIAYKTDFNLFQPLHSVLKKLNNDLVKMEDLPSKNKIISNVENKVIKFNQFAVANKYQTLTRTTDRMLSEIKNQNNLSQLSKNLNIDTDLIIDVVTKSTLASEKKHEIFKKVESFDDDFKMIKDFAFQNEKLHKGINKAKDETSNWLKIVGPFLTEEKMRAEQIGRYYMIALLGLLSFVLIGIFSSIAFNISARKKEIKIIQNYTDEIINHYLIGKENIKQKGLAEPIQEIVLRAQNYLNKRMSFGYVFQDTLPFPALMLDHNLRVIWHNKNFLESWNLSEEDINHEMLSWDYLAKMTNIGEDDPVLEAIKTRVGGIFQIKVNAKENNQNVPYEMYLTPLTVENEKRLMIYFYPLDNMQTTITDQSSELAKLVKNMIQATTLKNSDEIRNLKVEFDRMGIADIYLKIRELSEVQLAEQNQLISKMNSRDQQYKNMSNFLNTVEQVNLDNMSNTTEIIRSLKTIKEIVIKSFDNNSNAQSLIKDLEMLNENLIDRLENSIALNGNLHSFYQEINNCLPQLDLLKAEYRRIKMELLDKRSSLSLSLSQLVHVKKKISDTDSLEKFSIQYEKVINDFRAIDDLIVQLDKKLMTSEVLTTKFTMLSEERKEIVNSSSVVINPDMIKDYKAASHKLHSENLKNEIGIGQEELLVDTMKSVFLATKNNIANVRVLEKQYAESPRNADIN
jgi:hypothetical protein